MTVKERQRETVRKGQRECEKKVNKGKMRESAEESVRRMTRNEKTERGNEMQEGKREKGRRQTERKREVVQVKEEKSPAAVAAGKGLNWQCSHVGIKVKLRDKPQRVMTEHVLIQRG